MYNSYKHKYTNEIISRECYDKLPGYKQIDYEGCEEEPTHRVEVDEDDGNMSFAALAVTELLTSDSDSSSDFGNSDSSSDSSSDFGGFGGGDSGGGGASSDW